MSRIIPAFFLQVVCGLIAWFCYWLFFLAKDAGSFTPFTIFSIDLIKSIVLTVLGSAGMSAFAAILFLFTTYADGE